MSSQVEDEVDDEMRQQDTGESDVSEYLTPPLRPSSPASDFQSEAPQTSSLKRKSGRSGRPGAKRLKIASDEEYRKLLNENILDARKRFDGASPNGLNDSQISASVWTASEKNIFFSALTRLGRHACSGIASAIGTKSELEVRSYLLLLDEGLAEVSLRNPKSLLRFRNIPAAVELSEVCCEELEEPGDVLSQEQRALEEKYEVHKHGSSWLLDSNAARELESYCKQESLYNTEIPDTQNQRADDTIEPDASETSKFPTDKKAAGNALDALPAARLLKPRTWLELSTRVFMNSGDQSSSINWQTIVEPSEEPSIYHTAFSDFHRLTVSITQRIVQATLFQAMTRLRAASGPSKRPRTRAVERGDVLTALAILGMKTDAKHFWATAPRRCGLSVFHKPPGANSTNDDGPPLDYAELERLLSRRDSRDELGMEEGGELVESALENGEPPDAPSDHAEEIEEDESDLEADALDQEANRAEELRLWDMLGQDPPTAAERPHAAEGQASTGKRDMPMDAGKTATSNHEASEDLQSSPRNEDEESRSAVRNNRINDMLLEQQAFAMPGSPLSDGMDSPAIWHSAQPSPQYNLPDRPRHGINRASP
ncbi:hypothetical protein W97_09052 [Coniosporium apollinis CBS 100218]|uniref:Myb-like domain-containing protein n=1 Tax=Coniosporium apollinis (strain CBS 100218) TaxID=1168221 RepID=R7Z6Z9_CONA1|nr:uncharacterized protein W97_09052 [Coniosporium apollinis CBS 100218]EON69789.1 hypothetical protein W97_09052 [Coniosporium apollinis CBS 100218]